MELLKHLNNKILKLSIEDIVENNIVINVRNKAEMYSLIYYLENKGIKVGVTIKINMWNIHKEKGCLRLYRSKFNDGAIEATYSNEDFYRGTRNYPVYRYSQIELI